MKVVSNSTPIISLATIGRIDLLSQLFGMIYIPKAVYNELKSRLAGASVSISSIEVWESPQAWVTYRPD